MPKFVKIETTTGDMYIAPTMVTSIRAYPDPTGAPAAYSAVALLGGNEVVVTAPPELVVEMLG